jgi:hypothetical protein
VSSGSIQVGGDHLQPVVLPTHVGVRATVYSGARRGLKSKADRKLNIVITSTSHAEQVKLFSFF